MKFYKLKKIAIINQQQKRLKSFLFALIKLFQWLNLEKLKTFLSSYLFEIKFTKFWL